MFAALQPALPLPAGLLDDANAVHQRPAAHQVVDEVAARSPPNTGNRRRDISRQPLDRHQGPPRDVAGERGRVGAEHSSANRRMDAVRADQDVAGVDGLGPGFLHRELHLPGVLGVAAHGGVGAQRDARVRLRGLDQDAQQVAAMDVVVGKAVCLAHGGAQGRTGDAPAGAPMAELGTLRQEAPGVKPLRQPQVVQHAAGVGAQLNAGAHLAEHRRLLEHRRLAADPGQAERRRHSPNAAAGDERTARGALSDCHAAGLCANAGTACHRVQAGAAATLSNCARASVGFGERAIIALPRGRPADCPARAPLEASSPPRCPGRHRP